MEKKILEIIEEILMVPTGTITIDSVIEEVEGWDSLAHVLIIGAIEEKLGVSIPLDEAIEITKVKELVEKVDK